MLITWYNCLFYSRELIHFIQVQYKLETVLRKVFHTYLNKPSYAKHNKWCLLPALSTKTVVPLMGVFIPPALFSFKFKLKHLTELLWEVFIFPRLFFSGSDNIGFLLWVNNPWGLWRISYHVDSADISTMVSETLKQLWFWIWHLFVKPNNYDACRPTSPFYFFTGFMK